MKDHEISTPLSCAIRAGNSVLTKYLIRRGADVNAQNDCGYTALHLAANAGYLAFVKLLINNGAKIDAVTKGDEMLWMVFDPEDGSVIESLEGKTPLHYAAEKGHLAIVQYLIEKGASVDAKTYYKETALMLAQKMKRGSVVAYLMERQGSSQ